MTTPLEFPSQAWSRTLARLLHGDKGVQAALAEFGAFTAGAILEKGAGLAEDFCVYIDAAPGREASLTFCDDEDELEEMEPDYLVRASHALARDLLRAALAGEIPDPLRLLSTGQIKMKGDLGRVVRVGGRHPLVGLETLRTIPTKMLG